MTTPIPDAFLNAFEGDDDNADDRIGIPGQVVDDCFIGYAFGAVEDLADIPEDGHGHGQTNIVPFIVSPEVGRDLDRFPKEFADLGMFQAFTWEELSRMTRVPTVDVIAASPTFDPESPFDAVSLFGLGPTFIDEIEDKLDDPSEIGFWTVQTVTACYGCSAPIRIRLDIMLHPMALATVAEGDGE